MENNVIKLTDNASSGTLTVSDSVSNNIIGSNCGQQSAVASALGFSYPYYYSQPTTYIYFDINIKKVENGWLVNKNGKQFIAKTEKELVSLIVKEEK